MKASYNWLKEFVDFSIPPEELAHALTMAGLEVEATEKSADDVIFDIGVTPNRPDCLSIAGIAREISAILDLPFKAVSCNMSREGGSGPGISIEDPDLCLRYSARLISGVKPGPSPEWLSRRLESCGIRSMSNIVDVTNYVMLEMGQPLHAFDLDRLSGKKIVVKRADSADTFKTLDDEERSLSSEMLLIWDADKPVAVAGVMGGLHSEVSDATVNVLLESACFRPASVRRTSKRLNLSTESSYRFERGIDIEAVATALDRAAQMIAELAGGDISGITDIYPEPHVPLRIQLSFNRINSVIGVDIDESFAEQTLKNLGFHVERAGDGFAVTPPSYRNDVERDLDIIEEIARLFGYDNIPSTLPTVQMSAVTVNHTHETVRTIKNSFVNSGFSEVINFSFMSPDSIDRMHLGADDRRRNLVYIKNPLRKEESAMRTSLLPALIDNVCLNLNRGERMLRLFEISRVFLPSGNKLPDEMLQAIAVYHKDTTTRLWQANHESFFDLKGVVENLFHSLKIKDYQFERKPDSLEPYLHPGTSCSLIVNGHNAGSMGMLHPRIAASFDIKHDLSIVEFNDIEKMLSFVSREKKYSALPRYPYVERDIAIVVSGNITVDQARKTILGVTSNIIESVRLFDIYTGKPIPPDKKSLAFAIRYRSAERTLTDGEVDDLHAKIQVVLEDTLHAKLR